MMTKIIKVKVNGRIEDITVTVGMNKVEPRPQRPRFRLPKLGLLFHW